MSFPSRGPFGSISLRKSPVPDLVLVPPELAIEASFMHLSYSHAFVVRTEFTFPAKLFGDRPAIAAAAHFGQSP